MKITIRLSLLLFLLLSFYSNGQDKSKLIALTVPMELKNNANAVIRQNDIVLQIEDTDLVKVTQDRIVTVFNKNGMHTINAREYYSESRDIKDMQVIIYDALGNEIEKIKERDFRDASAVDGGTLYAENRVKYLEYTPRTYPLTFHYTARVNYKSTAFLPRWSPLEGFYCSTQSSSFTIDNEDNLPLKIKEVNFDGFNIETVAGNKYVASNLLAIEGEAYRPDFSDYAPFVKLAMVNFEMEGVAGVNNDWNDFGKWMFTDLLTGTQDLSKEVKDEIQNVVKNATTNEEKARLVYQYVQDRSRYISVQVGIGGWKPANASEVHDMAYGDCKGLTNYTMALMDEVGVKSYYAAIYGGSHKRGMDRGFSMTEGNHVILYLPKLNEEQDYWLECTSKNAPFGYMSDFTDDRDALVITPEGGKIVHTSNYFTDDNIQKSTGNFNIDQNGKLKGSIGVLSTGVQYAWRSDVQHLKQSDLKKRYLNRWDHLNGLRILNASYSDDRLLPEFQEQIELEVAKYGSKTGDLLLIQPVILNRLTVEPPSYESRKFDIEVERGYVDYDEYTITLANNLTVDALPEPVELVTEFGDYSLSYDYRPEENIIKVNRRVKIKEGVFDRAKYEDFRNFRTSIVKYDNSRGVLKIKA